jgi:peptidoglycan/LPS O-acetylase OafA/YrhL
MKRFEIDIPIGLGVWRLLLALLVVISHLFEKMIHGPAAYAVWGFFVLSGYLMTHVLRHKYGFDRAGLRDYAFNRFLRIFPAYWLTCVLGAILLLTLPTGAIHPSQLNPQFAMPDSKLGWLNNLTLMPFFGIGGNKLVPVSSALSIEIGAYLLLPLLACSRPAAWLGLVLSFWLNAQYGLFDQFAVRYSSFLTSFMAFAVGSLACHYKGALDSYRSPLVSVAAWLGHCGLWLQFPSYPWHLGLYVSVLLSAWVVLSLANQKSGAVDRWCGDLSYPVYLLHTTIGAYLFTTFAGVRSFQFFLVSLGCTLVVSVVFVYLFDRKLHRLKRRAEIPTTLYSARPHEKTSKYA